MLPFALLAFAAGPLNGPVPPGAIARLGEYRRDYRIGVLSAAFNRDGSCVLSSCFLAGYRGGLFVWDVKTGRLVQEAPGQDRAWSGVLAPHPREDVVLRMKAGGLALWDIKGRKIRWDRRGKVIQASWGQRGRWFVALNTDRAIVLHDGRTGKRLNSLPLPFGGHRHIAASPVRREVAVLQENGTLFLYDPFTEKQRWKATDDDFRLSNVCAFCPRGEWVLTCGPDVPMKLWNARDGKLGRVLVKAPYGCSAAVFAPSGLVVGGTRFGQVFIMHPTTGKVLRTWPTVDDLEGLACSPDGGTIATWHKRCPCVLLWDSRTGKLLNPHAGRDELLNSVEYTGERELVTRGWSGQVTRWDTATGKATPLPLRPFPVEGRAWSRDGRFLVGCSEDGLVLYDHKAGKQHQLAKRRELWSEAIGFSRNGRWVAARLNSSGRSAYNGKFVVWDTATGTTKLERKGVTHWEFSPDGKQLVYLTKDRIWRMVGLEGGEEKTIYRFDNAFGFFSYTARWSPDSRHLAIQEGEQLAILDAQKGTLLRVLGLDEGLSYPLVEFSADNRLLAVHAVPPAALGPPSDSPVYVYSVETGQRLHTFTKRAGSISGLAFSPRGDTLASCSDDGTILLWDLTGRMHRPCRLTAASFAPRWKALAGRDAVRAEAALWDIACSPQAPALLRKVVRPQRGKATDQLKKHIAGLDSDDFETRTRAEAALLAHGPGATGALRNLIETVPSLEARLRIARVMRQWAAAPEARRLSRAVLALEKAGTPQAKALLKKLASGEPGAPLTEDANAALTRLGK
jgi:WD40 repeat protein